MKQLGILALHVAAGAFVGWVTLQLGIRLWTLEFWLVAGIGLTFSSLAIHHLVDGDKQ